MKKKILILVLSVYTIQSHTAPEASITTPEAATDISSIQTKIAATHKQAKETSKAIQDRIKEAKANKAIQNKKDGLEGIRKIYADFFNQGQGVRYNTQDMKIEIYQNAVEVKARYEIEQILKMGGEKKVWRGNVRWVLDKENGVLKIISLDYQHQKSV